MDASRVDASRIGGRAPATSTRIPVRVRVRTATLLCAAAALAAGAAVPAAVPAAAQTARAPMDPSPVVVVDCFSQAQVRPREYLLACGDGNNRLVRLRWDSWGQRTATATGTDMVNDCTPYCAAGKFRAYPVRVTLSHPRPWPGHPDVQRYTSIRLLYTDTAPPPVSKDVTYKLVY
ncbi:hypothetical protein [Streptomyces vinaceus]|uniref:hypothetical protein n=1 Tax=Streptomyces vinaceus TaxID=1960 RepID=UPI0010E79619|nr:hypothetical protein [Streptomyces vinaceus]GHE38935.1 hypothetical protein GCM10017778_22930 [Streptomyces vinaceus]